MGVSRLHNCLRLQHVSLRCSKDLHSHGSDHYWHGRLPHRRVAREEEVAREDEAVMMPLTSLCLCFSQRDMKIKITYLFIY